MGLDFYTFRVESRGNFNQLFCSSLHLRILSHYMLVIIIEATKISEWNVTVLKTVCLIEPVKIIYPTAGIQTFLCSLTTWVRLPFRFFSFAVLKVIRTAMIDAITIFSLYLTVTNIQSNFICHCSFAIFKLLYFSVTKAHQFICIFEEKSKNTTLKRFIKSYLT